MNASRNLIEKFIYSCSHDLRSPVSSIQGLVRIAGYYPHHEEIHKCLEMIENCTHKMDKLISSLQEFMTNGQRLLKIEPINPGKLIHEVKNEFKNQLDACAIDLVAEVSETASWTVDAYSLRAILRHVVSNSISFHDNEKSSRKINVRVETYKTGTILEIADNGKGIPADQQEKIFDIFYRGSETSIGLGMGLFLAKGLTEKMGGSMACRSTPGEGTNIQAFFPRTAE